VPLHRFETHRGLAAGWIRKSRRFRAEVLIPLGNLYLRLQEAQVEVLSVDAWIGWELLVARQLGREVLIAQGGLGIETRVLAGRTLEDILREDGSLEDKLASITAASVALRELHQLSLSGGSVSNWAFSHGDATCRNVMRGGPEKSAHWFDFDTRHVTSQPTDFRQADDVRALLMSCAVWLAPADYEQCVACIVDGYADDRIASTVQRMLQLERQARVFHLAQAPLSFDNWHLLRDVVLAIPARSEGAKIVVVHGCRQGDILVACIAVFYSLFNIVLMSMFAASILGPMSDRWIWSFLTISSLGAVAAFPVYGAIRHPSVTWRGVTIVFLCCVTLTAFNLLALASFVAAV
jgi:hypothetical protein